MSKSVVAITSGVYYVDKTKWCVKDLNIGHRLDGTLFWQVSGLGCNFDSASEAEAIGVHLATVMKIPFMHNIKHGSEITKRELNILKQYGVAE